jgi:hypothetical protein
MPLLHSVPGQQRSEIFDPLVDLIDTCHTSKQVECWLVASMRMPRLILNLGFTIYVPVARAKGRHQSPSASPLVAGRESISGWLRRPGIHHNFPSPLMTSLTSFNPSTANCTMFASLSVPSPVSTSLVAVPFSLATANATYPGVRFLNGRQKVSVATGH